MPPAWRLTPKSVTPETSMVWTKALASTARTRVRVSIVGHVNGDGTQLGVIQAKAHSRPPCWNVMRPPPSDGVSMSNPQNG